jgi:hypothetical protein
VILSLGWVLTSFGPGIEVAEEPFWKSFWFQVPILIFLLICWMYPDDLRANIKTRLGVGSRGVFPSVLGKLEGNGRLFSALWRSFYVLLRQASGPVVLLATAIVLIYSGSIAWSHIQENHTLVRTDCPDTIFVHLGAGVPSCRRNAASREAFSQAGGSYFSAGGGVRHFGLVNNSRQCTAVDKVSPGVLLMRYLKFPESIVGVHDLCSVAYPNSKSMALRPIIFGEDESNLFRGFDSSSDEALDIKCVERGCTFFLAKNSYQLGELISLEPDSTGAWSSIFVPATLKHPVHRERGERDALAASQGPWSASTRVWRFGNSKLPLGVRLYDSRSVGKNDDRSLELEIDFDFNPDGRLMMTRFKSSKNTDGIFVVKYTYDGGDYCIGTSREDTRGIKFNWQSCKPQDYLPIEVKGGKF